VARTNRLISKVDGLRNLEFHAIPTRPLAIARAVRSEKCIVLMDEAGRVYTSQVTSSVYWRNDRQMRHTLDCLIKMGALSESAIVEHRAAREADELAQQRKWAARAVLDGAKTLGLSFNKTQERMLDAAEPKEAA
jgi:hypothetical protein